ncbi:MAG: hypothetical protein KGV50_03885 [Gammaproteobacteria bacterium]|nr:hypothetical protein [Gammaproteobacteria bacterium]
MTTEQIDLASVKHLINSVWELKKEVQSLSEKLTASETERQNLANLASSKEERFNTEINELKSSYANASQSQEQANQQTVEKLVREHTAEKNKLIEGYENQLKKSTSELQQKNETLQKALDKVSGENKAIISRIRGIEG